MLKEIKQFYDDLYIYFQTLADMYLTALILVTVSGFPY